MMKKGYGKKMSAAKPKTGKAMPMKRKNTPAKPKKSK